MGKTIFLVANGDLRLSANQKCWPVQAEVEAAVIAAIKAEGHDVIRGHDYDTAKQHGFIDSQKRGIEVFRTIPNDAPLVVVEAVWQYSQHLMPGLLHHRGPILTIANWSGTWPGLVGLLNLNASLTKAGTEYSSLWSENFTDDFFRDGLKRWMRTGKIKHDTSHVHRFTTKGAPRDALAIGKAFAQELRARQAIMGVFDEGCMGMYNAILPDELLHPTGVFKERLSQSALVAKMRTVAPDEA